MAASMDSDMWTATLLILDLLCVAPCVVLKIPQLWTLYTTKTTKGLSWASTILELTGYTIFTLYMFGTSKPIMQYMEYLFLIVQVLVLIVFMLYYSDRMDFGVVPYSGLYFAATGIIGLGITPLWFSALLLTLSTPISAAGMLFQIVAIYNIKDSGSVSFTSWFIAWATGLLRIISSLIEGDMLVVGSYALTNILRLSGCAIILYYRPQAKKFK